MRFFIFLHIAIFTFAINVCFAQQDAPTWSDDVACIIYSHCSSCHNPNGIGAEQLLLLSYADAYAARFSILDAIESREMPPWPPDQSYNPLAHDRSLSDDEITTVSNWVNADAPLGNTANEPTPPIFSSSWEIPNPDYSVRIPNYTIPAITNDLYRCFAIPLNVPANTYLTGFEVIPGNRNIVHHVLLFQDTTGQGLTLDNADPQPGYANGPGGVGVQSAKLIGGWVPGSTAKFAPPGMGMRLNSNTSLIAQIHYPEGSDGLLDSTRINIKTQTGGFLREMTSAAILNHLLNINEPLVIPANTVKTFYEQYTIPQNVSVTITGIGPHAHLVCESMRAFAVTPQNDTIRLIDIPHWDFHWQGFYDFKQAIKLPGGTRVYCIATYNNTTSNPHLDPNNIQLVTLGEETSDEMMLFYFTYTLYFPNDENIVIDSASHLAHYLNCAGTVATQEPQELFAAQVFPNPTTDNITVTYDYPEAIWLQLTNVVGQSVKQQNLSALVTNISVGDLPKGIYFITLSDKGKQKILFSDKLIISR
ncbi:MAG: T9SS type A sorting domain-containing protein [Saprospiraceae bacterium]|nr:T9SS type A sorting domain-containing protein [Saprospiraceae bacterium]MBP7679564.1 T9SS type A sorting domain-containing protein [Saprospiraceae bacterium]